jgi:hypothetical protein
MTGDCYSISGFAPPEQSSIAPMVAGSVVVEASVEVAVGDGTGARADDGPSRGSRDAVVVALVSRVCAVEDSDVDSRTSRTLGRNTWVNSEKRRLSCCAPGVGKSLFWRCRFSHQRPPN